MAISLQHVKSVDYPADAPSRVLSVVDSTLAPRTWSTVQRVFGGPAGHTTCDLLCSSAYPFENFAWPFEQLRKPF